MTDAETAKLAEQQAASRKGRACERFIIALPVEATPTQREALVKAFCETITKGVAGYLAAIHDKSGNDIFNPHVHIVAFDVQVKTGGRGRPRSTIGMARKNAVETTAALWATIHNRMMNGWGYGHDSHITHLSYASRGIGRIPEIHEGAASRKIYGRGDKVAAKTEWHHVDQGNSRAEANAVIREINSIKETENEQFENYANNRLGRNHDYDRAEFEECRENGGAHGRSSCRGSGGSAPPFASVKPIGKKRRGNEGPPRFGFKPMSPPFLTSGPAPAYPHIPLDRRFHRGGRLRRVFRELVMLRDSLRARLIDRRPQKPQPNEMRHSHTTRIVKRFRSHQRSR